MPWISGTMNQLHGKIDIEYSVKGTKSEGVVHFRSLREGGKSGLVGFSSLFILLMFPGLFCELHVFNGSSVADKKVVSHAGVGAYDD